MNDSLGEPRARIMIVDDHPMWRDAVERDLTARGYDVVATAGSVREAVDRARATRPDLVLMDMNLPGGDGDGVLRLILEDLRRREARCARGTGLAGARQTRLSPAARPMRP